MDKYLISSAYIYPICPLSINHARMFLFGDIMARYARFKGKEVFFPIASHYSGNTAHKIAKIFKKYYVSNEKLSPEEERTITLFKNVYQLSPNILKTFTEPLNILSYYNRETLWELRSLGVSGDYKNAYTTEHKDFGIFINILISYYKDEGLLTLNDKNELALDYDNELWKKEVLQSIELTEFIQEFHKANILSATKNIRNDWGILRDDGYGVKYQDKWIIDPMFDSELFTLFDIYIRVKNELQNTESAHDVFKNLFGVLKNGECPKYQIVKSMIDWLPCDVCVCEEHLKNWIVKKFYAETFLLKQERQTKSYFILGMGLLDGVRMSASRGTAILASDLITTYGPLKARLIMLLGGGHPSKNYNYEKDSCNQADKLLSTFTRYFIHLLTSANYVGIKSEMIKGLPYSQEQNNLIIDIEQLLEKGYYRQAITELMGNIPKKNPSPTVEEARLLIFLYERYLTILLPNILVNFSC